jgi:hypothetical protein
MPPSPDAKIQLRRSATVKIPTAIANGEPVFCDPNGVLFVGVVNEPTIVGVKCGLSRPAIESIPAGSMVNLTLDMSQPVARLADRSTGRICHGYAIASAAIGEQVQIVTACGSILTVNRPDGSYYLGSQGAISTVVAGTNKQSIGSVVGGVLIFNPQPAFA